MKILTIQNFDEILQTNRFVVVDFWAAWCSPCRQIVPLLEELEEEYTEKILFAKVNIDQNPDLERRYKIYTIPNICFFVKGELVNQITGLKSKDDLKNFFDLQLKNIKGEKKND